LLALERVPDARDQHRLSLFYAESWALVHYLMLGGASTTLEWIQPNIENAAQLQEKLIAYLAAGRFRALRLDAPPAGSREAGNGAVRTLRSAESLAIRASCLVEGERPEAALPLLNRALARDPRDGSVLETLGYLRFRQNDPVEAARWLDRAIDAGSATHLAYFYRAILAGPAPRSSEGQPVPAVDYLKRSIEIAPEFAPAYMRLADVYTEHLDRLDDALPLVRRATQLEPENGIYWVGLSKILVRLHKPAEAQEAGERALAVSTSADTRALVRGLLRDLGLFH
jgi:tetratricopeptide (TPR) repeat protein